MSAPRYASLVICTTPRSGSTFLCRLLAATGRAGNPESWFHSPSFSDWLSYYDLNPAPFRDQTYALKAVFAAAIEKGTANTGVFGLRMQRGSFDHFAGQLTRLFPGPDTVTDKDRINAAFGPTLFLHLTREDKLAQAISLVRAEQSGLWHRAASGRELERLAPHRDPVYDRSTIAARRDHLKALDASWARWFRDQGICPLRVSYDTLSTDPQRVISLVTNHIWRGRPGTGPVPLPTAKLADQLSLDWARRFTLEQSTSS
jgi:LPS sulfotransferase NodH